jgi:hypothetical protein
MLDSFLIFEIAKSSWNKIVENSLRFVNHIFEKFLFYIDSKEMHVRNLLDSKLIKRSLLIRVFFGEKKL